MKHTIRRTIQWACTGAVLIAAASFAADQAPPAVPAPAPAAPAPAPAPPPAMTDEQASYFFGMNLGETLHTIGLGSEVRSEAVMKGLKEGLQGRKATNEEKKQVQEYVHTAMLASGERNKAAAKDFLAANGSKKGVVTTESGLQYKIVKPGDAKAPPVGANDEVVVNYRGKLLDGTEFDSSFTKGVPFTTGVNGVIKGWQEALVLMKPGESVVLWIPPELAYGANPRPGIPANSLLTFDVDLISAKAKEGASALPAQPKLQIPPPPKPSTTQ